MGRSKIWTANTYVLVGISKLPECKSILTECCRRRRRRYPPPLHGKRVSSVGRVPAPNCDKESEELRSEDNSVSVFAVFIRKCFAS